MPYNWVRVPSSPPREIRDEIREACRTGGVARLCENQTYYYDDDQEHAYALIEVRNVNAFQSILEERGWTVERSLVDADEMADVLSSGKRDDED
jgi:hypothetical protein